MRVRAIVGAGCVLAALGGCYHATVETGARPSAVTYEKSFASSWIGGLVPPSTVSTASQCTSGVARVETQLSFVNMLVGGLTFGIYTPMHIKVTCAVGGGALGPEAGTVIRAAADTPDARAEALTKAAWVSRESGREVTVVWK